MTIERHYLAALDLTQRMLAAASAQNWEALSRLEVERAELIAAIAPPTAGAHALEPALAHRVAGIIAQIECANGQIIEHAEAWQKDARILLRLDKTAVV